MAATARDAEAAAAEIAAEAHDTEWLPQCVTQKLQLPQRVMLKLLLQKRWSLMLQLPKRLPPNLLPKRMTLNCCRSA